MNKYMHLIDGRPAHFDGEQIRFVRNGASLGDLLVDSLAQIRRERKLSAQWRYKHNWFDDMHYGYLRVKVK